MLTRLGHAVVRHAKLILVLTLLFFLAAGAIGGNVAQHLSQGGFEDDTAESTIAFDILEEQFGEAPPELVLVVTAPAGATVDDPAVRQAGLSVVDELRTYEDITQVQSYWSLGNAPPLRTEDGKRALVFANLAGSDDENHETVEGISAGFNRAEGFDADPMATQAGPVEVRVGGFEEVFREVGHQIESDLATAEIVAGAITMVLLIIVFGSVVSASLPLAVGAVSIVGSFLILRLLSELTLVSVFSLSLVTAMGLGLAIDYSLFVVSRFREELGRGADIESAVVQTVATAGRTVLFSGLTVAVSLSALLIFPLAFFRSFAYGGIPVIMLAATMSIISLPAALAVLGPRVDKWRVRQPRIETSETGFWHRMAVLVMKRPLQVGIPVTLLLIMLGIPFLRIELGLPDDRVLPPGNQARFVQDVIRDEFSTTEAGYLSVVAPDGGDPIADQAAISAYADELAALDNVARVDTPFGPVLPADADLSDLDLSGIDIEAIQAQYRERFTNGSGWYLNVVPDLEPISAEGERLAHDIRDLEAPAEVLVTGSSAMLVDTKASLFSRLPLGAAWIVLATFVLLFLMSGSLLVPAKAVVLNMLSLSATFGAMVWVFQDGNFSGLLDFEPTGTLAISAPVLMFCVAFGLSMDYEVFLLSRIKEEYDRSGDNTASVAAGLERTGRIVTAAALLISVVFISMAIFADVAFIKLFGVGLALAVIADAFLIRATLVPAFMRIAGEANWWAPAPLRRIYDRYGLKEPPGEPAPVHANGVRDELGIEEPPENLAELDDWVDA